MSIIEASAQTPIAPSLETDEVGQILEAAAEYIEKYGWAHKHCMTANGGFCAAVAILTRNRELSRTAAMERLAKYVNPHYEDTAIAAVVRWNDNEDRTKEEVCRALREASAS